MMVGLLVTGGLAITGWLFGFYNQHQIKVINQENSSLQVKLDETKQSKSSLHHELDKVKSALGQANKEKDNIQTKINNKSTHEAIYKDFDQTSSKLMNVLYEYNQKKLIIVLKILKII